jgi:hypothetical protein
MVTPQRPLKTSSPHCKNNKVKNCLRIENFPEQTEKLYANLFNPTQLTLLNQLERERESEKDYLKISSAATIVIVCHSTIAEKWIFVE